MAGGVPASSRGATSAGGVTVLNYTEFTSGVAVTVVAEASAPVIVTASAGVVVDGATLICIEFFAAGLILGATASSSAILDLWDDTAAAQLGRIIITSNGAAGGALNLPAYARRYFTPAAGTRTYSVRGWASVSAGFVTAGSGGTGAAMPGYIRVTSGS